MGIYIYIYIYNDIYIYMSPYVKNSNHLIDELDQDDVALYHRALLCEHHIFSSSGFTPLEEDVLFTEVIDPIITEVKAVPEPQPKT